MKKKHKKIIIFDMDGTLYEFKGGSFKNSGLYDAIIENTLRYICDKLEKTKLEAREALNFILDKYGNSISIGLEKEFKIDRHDYFNFAWNIDAKKYVQTDASVKALLMDLKKDFKLVLLSDAPMIWISKVLSQLEVVDIFGENIFSGEGDIRKEFENAFEKIIRSMNIKSGDCIVIGDQEDTDIMPAKKVGMKTVYIGKDKNGTANYKINNILELKSVIKNL